MLLIIIIAFLLGAMLGVILPIVLTTLKDRNATKRNVEKKRFCHHCMMAYLSDTSEDYVYCPVCGKPLEYFDEHKCRFHEPEEEPFKEFNKDGE